VPASLGEKPNRKKCPRPANTNISIIVKCTRNDWIPVAS
jgi:hypothetical protein